MLETELQIKQKDSDAKDKAIIELTLALDVSIKYNF